MNNILFLMMGGVGSRTGLSIPKQFFEIKGKPIYEYILQKYLRSNLINRVIIICNKSYIDIVKAEVCKYKNISIEVVPGGSSRTESVLNGIRKCIDLKCPFDANILIHDTTHPYLDYETLKLALNLTSKEPAITFASHVWDTVYLSTEHDCIDKTLPRSRIAVGASPEIFKFSLLVSLLEEPDPEKYTSIGNYIESRNINIKIVWSDLINLKITYKEDLKLLLSAKQYFLED